MADIEYIVLYFYLSSFIGWILESVFKTIQDKKITNSGFLYGPFVPIYGFGALIIYFLSFLLRNNSQLFQVTVYSLSAVFLEYLVSFIFEKIFGMKLWDYRDEKFNIRGRICLKFSLIWALLVIFMVEIGQKVLFKTVFYVPQDYVFIVVLCFTVYIIIDTFFSFKLFFRFANIVNYLKKLTIEDIRSNINYIYKNTINLDIKKFLAPVRKFDNLGFILRRVSSVNNNRVYFYLKNSITNILKKETGENFMDSDYSKNKEFYSYISEIINTEEYQKLKNYKHHNKSIYDHNLMVAYLSFKIGKFLNLKMGELVRGALFHDFFYYNWRYEKPSSGKLHAFEHPKESYINAKKYFKEISKIEEDIITKHMWPLTLIPPKYLESFVVSIVDKIVATREFTEKKEN